MDWRNLPAVITVFVGFCLSAPAQTPDAAPEPAPPATGHGYAIPQNVLWEAALGDFSAEAYAAAVEDVFQAVEAEVDQPITPGEHRRVGLKVYTNSGSGLATPRPLVRAVIEALHRRGYARSEIFLIDQREHRLRAAGFLPQLSRGGDTFHGSPVLWLNSGDHYDPDWFYDSPLPSFGTAARDAREADLPGEDPNAHVDPPDPDDRKSFLPTPLLFDLDFWINLPVATDHRATVINGALVNPTLWSVSNNRRFFVNPATAPAAAVEIAAIPEYREKWLLPLMGLERYQFIGGPIFNSLYTRPEPLLWASSNPVLLDARILGHLNRARRAEAFGPLPEAPPLLHYAERLNLGQAHPPDLRLEPIPSLPHP